MDGKSQQQTPNLEIEVGDLIVDTQRKFVGLVLRSENKPNCNYWLIKWSDADGQRLVRAGDIQLVLKKTGWTLQKRQK